MIQHIQRLQIELELFLPFRKCLDFLVIDKLPVKQVIPLYPVKQAQLPFDKQVPPFKHDKTPPALHPRSEKEQIIVNNECKCNENEITYR